MPAQAQSELTRCADALAQAVADLLPPDRNPALITSFRAALGDLLAATLGGATSMAAGAVVALDNKIDHLAKVRGERMRQLQLDVDRIAARVHALEDSFLDDGQIGQLGAALLAVAVEVERLKERAAGDG